MGIFDTLHIGYSGLSTSQAAINTTSHNIANVNTEGYSRQRISQKVSPPIHNLPGDVGNGTQVDSIVRIHDEFVYSRLKSSSAKLEYDTFTKDTLQEITQYLPDLQENGIANDLKQFFNDWSNVSQYPGDDAQKVLLVQSADLLAQGIQDTRTTLEDVQTRLNEQLSVTIDEVNSIAEEIANINKDINRVESTYEANANDLRDQRDQLELRLSKLIDTTVFKGKLHSDNSSDRALTDQGTDYNINVAGVNIVDGASFHPLEAGDASSDHRLNAVFFIDHNHQKVDITSEIRGGKVGAIVDLRGDGVDGNGNITNSKIQDYIDYLDNFAARMIESVNSIYAKSPQSSISSDTLEGLKDSSRILDHAHIEEGSFDVIVYDTNGNEVAKRSIAINHSTTINETGDTDSIIAQLNSNSDDNGDNDGTNDLDDLFVVNFGNEAFSFKPLQEGYTIAINDNGTNFAGATGMHRFFAGSDANDIAIEQKFVNDPSKIQSYQSPIDGNNDVANEMVTLQYASLSFDTPNGLSTTTNTIEGFYRSITAQIASDAATATSNHTATEILYKTVDAQMQSVSGVDMDEELVNLMKYQTSYQASAKVITAIDEMINTLLGMK